MVKFKKKKIKIIVSIIIVLVVFCCTVLTFIILKNENSKTQKQTNAKIDPKQIKSTIEEFVNSEKDIESKKTSAPKSGPLNYQLVGTFSKKEGVTRYLVYSIEMDDSRLIELNDLITSQLTSDGKIDQTTQEYYIDYFNDETTAKSYFNSLDKKLNGIERLEQYSHYTATMAYIKKIGTNHLISIPDSKIIKKY